jgi:hypothetical protein
MIHYLVNHHVTGHLVFVLVSEEGVMVCPTIDNPASYKIRAIIRFLHAKNMSAARKSIVNYERRFTAKI